MSLREKLLKNSTIKKTALLKDSVVFNKPPAITTPVPAINVALSGTIDGGLSSGLLQLAGPSKHFKTAFGLLLASTFLKHHKDGVILFYDSEFGTPESYIRTFDIDQDRVVHTPITNIEELKHDVMNQLQEVTEGENLFIFIDSIGNLASKKEVEDAIEGKSVADMTRAKALKSLFRMVTPHLTLKNIPLVVINHTYKEMSMFPKDIVGGGTGSYYSADDIWIIGRQQEKDGTELAGYNFIINIEKSRTVKEKSKIPVTVMMKGGIQRWSGMFDWALEGGYLVKPKKGTYQIKGEEKEYKEDDLDANVWKHLLKTTDLATFIKKKYTLAQDQILEDENDKQD
jgi:RecA/RadA recombinase